MKLFVLLALPIVLHGGAIAEENVNGVHAGKARVGVFWPSTHSRELQQNDLEEALRKVGYVAGQILVLEHRAAAERDEFAKVAADLVNAKCDVVIAVGTPAAASLKRRSSEVPVVFFDAGDPVAAGLVEDLSKPGGNVTGFASLGPELSIKLIELAKEALPTLSRVGVLWDRANPANARQVEELVRTASSFKLDVDPVGIRTNSDFPNALGMMRKRHVGAV